MAKNRLSASLGILGVAAVAALIVHVVAGTTFPNPWPDEIDFLTPAAQLARHFTLAAPQLGAPHGMFWEPELMYFIWAPVLRFAPLAVASGRWVSFVMILAAGGGFFTAGRRAGAPPIAAAVAVGLWLLSPLTILAGNIARPEAMVLAFVAWSAAATLDGRRVLALSLAVFACFAHAAGVPFALVLAVPNVFVRVERPATRRWEWGVAALAAAFVAFELVHFGTHLSVALDQLRFQGRVKSHVTGDRSAYLVIAVGSALALLLLRRRLTWRCLLLGALALAGLLIVLVGWEEWYQVYALATAPLLGALVVLANLGAAFRTDQLRRIAGVAVVVLFAAFVVSPGQPIFAGMALGRHPHEWAAFEHRVSVELLRLDAGATRPTTVVFNDQSGLPWPLVADRLGAHLRLRKQTLVTETLGTADYAVVIPGHLAPPPGRVVARLTSPHHQFNAVLVQTR